MKVVIRVRIPVSGNATEVFDIVPTYFSTIMASVVALEVVEKSLTPSTKSGNAAKFFDNAPIYFSTILLAW